MRVTVTTVLAFLLLIIGWLNVNAGNNEAAIAVLGLDLVLWFFLIMRNERS